MKRFKSVGHPATKNFTETLASVGIRTDAGGAPVDEDGDRLVDAYGHISFPIGEDEDFVCFDAGGIDTDHGRVVVFSAVVNSETGSFIEDLSWGVYVETDDDDPAGQSLAVIAGDTWSEGYQWCMDNDVDVPEGTEEDQWAGTRHEAWIKHAEAQAE